VGFCFPHFFWRISSQSLTFADHTTRQKRQVILGAFDGLAGGKFMIAYYLKGPCRQALK